MTLPSAPAVRPVDLPERSGAHVGLALASLSLGSFVIGAGEFGIMGLLPTMAEDLGVTIPQAGLLVTGYALGVVFGAPLLAVLTSRWERKRTLFLLALVFVIGNLACALAPTYGLLMAARLFTALAHGAFFGIGAVLAAEIARPGKEAQAISMLFVGMTLANVFGVPLGTVIGQSFGWRSAFLVVTALAAVTAAMIALFVPVSRPRPGVRFAEELRALVRPPVLLAMALSVLASSALFVLYTYIAPLLVGVTGLAETSVPYLLFVLGTGMTIGNLLGARLADWKLMPSIMGLFAAMAAILTGIHLFADSPVPMVALMLLWGMVVFGLTSPIQMRIVATSKGARNLASTINQSAFNLGNAFGAWVGAMMISAGLGYDTLPLASAALALCALAVAAVSWRMDGRSGTTQGTPSPAPLPGE